MELRNSFDNTVSKKDVVFTDKSQSKTQQQFKKQCDINVIMKRHLVGGESPEINPQVFADVSDIPDLQTMKNKIIDVMDQFVVLPVDVRKRYNHSPEEFLMALQNPKEKEFLTEHGIFVKPQPAERNFLEEIANNTKKELENSKK